MALCIVHCFNLHVQHTLALSFSYLQQGSELKQEEEEETKKNKNTQKTLQIGSISLPLMHKLTPLFD